MKYITINGKKLSARKDETVLDIAQKNNIYIPTLCYNKELSAYGGCRLCLIEVEGWSRPVAACTLPAQDGMIVRTDSALLAKLRQFNLQLILSEHPHACLICDREKDCAKYQECIQKSAITVGCKFCSKNGNCELQELVDDFKIKEIPFESTYRSLEVEKYDPFFERDYNLCVLCGRCVRVCNEVRGAGTLDFHHRGPETLVGTAFNLPHLETGCQFCGACVDICPTGALRDRYSKWYGVCEHSVKTRCALCNIGCAIRLNINGDRVVNSAPDNNQICVRGRYGIVPLIYHPKRVTQPLLRRKDRLVQVGWEEALSFLAAKLNEHDGKTGFLFSPQMTLEAITSVCGLKDNFSVAIQTASNYSKTLDFKEIKSEDVFIIMNTDMISNYSPLLLKIKAKLKKKGLFIVIDSIENESSKMADLWLRPEPGKEKELLNELFSENLATDLSGVLKKDIIRCRELLKDRRVHILYNTFNLQNLVVPQNIRTLPLPSNINTLQIPRLRLEYSYTDILQDKGIDCLYLIGTAPKLSRKYNTIIVQDCFLPPFKFDLFLPAATFAETKGSFIDIEGKKRKLQKAIESPGQAKPDIWILEQVHKRLDRTIKNTRAKVSKEGKISKYPGIDKSYPYHLIVRENCYTFRAHILSRLLKGFNRLRQDQYVWINKSVAKKFKLNHGKKITVVGRDFELVLPVKISKRIPDNSLLLHAHPSLGVTRSQPVKVITARK